jgi:hypothetical protein
MSVPSARQAAPTGGRHDAGQTAREQVGWQPDHPCEFIVGLAAPVAQYLDARSPDAGRRRTLADTDQLLNEIEELRLEAGGSLSSHLLDRIADIETEIIGQAQRSRIDDLNLRGAHELVLGLQHLLMAANPGNSRAPRLGATMLRKPARRFRRDGPAQPLEAPQDVGWPQGWSRR